MSALLVQNTLKFLLGFGTVSEYVGYSALSDFFTRDALRPSPDCDSEICRQRQAQVEPEETVESVEKVVEPIHMENKWKSI